MDKTLTIDTPRFTKFTRKELHHALNIDELLPIMKTEDGIPVVLEGNAIMFSEMSDTSRNFKLNYYFTDQITRNTSFAPVRPRSKTFLPKETLIIKHGNDRFFTYMGIAELRILYRTKSVANTFSDSKSHRYYRTLHVIEAAGTFLDVPVTEEPKRKIEQPVKPHKLHKEFGAIDPKTYEVVTKAHYRSPQVAEYARQKANGICQLCGQPAPFNDASGRPYLEVHHVKWLSRGGGDTYDNVVALCPNCHSRMHVLDDPEDIKTLESVIKSQNDN